jgi:membrane-bound ClpP family serine protease
MDYVFFSERLRDDFVAYAAEFGVACALATDPAADDEVAVLLATVDDEVAESTLDALEERYDELMEEQSGVVAQEQGWYDNRVAAVSVTLEDGTVRTIRLAPDLANRLLDVFSAGEIHDLVTAVARGLAGPEEPRLCRKV